MFRGSHLALAHTSALIPLAVLGACGVTLRAPDDAPASKAADVDAPVEQSRDPTTPSIDASNEDNTVLVADPDDPTTPPRPVRYVFVTSDDYALVDIASVAFADKLCMDHARAGDVRLRDRTFKAWLSDRQASPSTRFAAVKSEPMPYVRLDDRRVAASYEDIARRGVLVNAINLDEKNVSRSGRVWTGTLANGTPSGNDCNAWRGLSPDGTTPRVTLGWSATFGAGWSAMNPLAECEARHRLYCFED